MCNSSIKLVWPNYEVLYYPNTNTDTIQGHSTNAVDMFTIEWLQNKYARGEGGVLATDQFASYICFVEQLMIEKCHQPHLIICDTHLSLLAIRKQLPLNACSMSLFGESDF